MQRSMLLYRLLMQTEKIFFISWNNKNVHLRSDMGKRNWTVSVVALVFSLAYT